MTNYEYIKKMPIKEMAEMLEQFEYCRGKVMEECDTDWCYECAGCCSSILEWLQKAVNK